MHYIIETPAQLEQIKGMGEECYLRIITTSPIFHPKLTTPSLIYIRPLNDRKGYIISIDHSEGLKLDFEKVKSVLRIYKTVYCLDSKYHSYFIDNFLVDLNFTLIENREKPKEISADTTIDLLIYSRCMEVGYWNVNKVIPIGKHYEHYEKEFEYLAPFIKKTEYISNQEFYQEYQKVYKQVEESGIGINTECFPQYFTPQNSIKSFYKTGKIYTRYNLYNITTRPTNAFNGINFLAINKENHSRQCFVPRNDFFIEFDFDGYHIRLIANLINYNLPNNISIHTYFGQQYFNKEELTEEEYRESKQITFQNIYGGIAEEWRHIPFFEQLEKYIQALDRELFTKKKIQMPTGKWLYADEVKNSLTAFNYFIQNLETKTNVHILGELFKVLDGMKSKILLVVYDSFLLDFSREDGKQLLTLIQECIKKQGYKVKVKYGENYDSLKSVNYL